MAMLRPMAALRSVGACRWTGIKVLLPMLRKSELGWDQDN